MLKADKDWTFDLFCQDAIAGKRERIRQFLKNKRRYEEEKKARLAAKMASAKQELTFP